MSTAINQIMEKNNALIWGINEERNEQKKERQVTIIYRNTTLK
jgi:hypothetical protein